MKTKLLTITLIAAALIAIGVVVYLFAFKGDSAVADKLYYKLEYTELIQEAADEHKVNPYWIAAIIRCESNFNPKAKSGKSAKGLMQLMPATAKDVARWELLDTNKYNPEDLSDPQTNIQYGTAYLRYLVERYHEMEPAVSAYNAGPGNVDKWLKEGHNIRDVVEFPETRDYLVAVVKAKEAYERLYPDAFDWN